MKKQITADYYPLSNKENSCTLCDLQYNCAVISKNYMRFDCVDLCFKLKTKVPDHIELHLQDLIKLYRYAEKWYMLLMANDETVNTITDFQILKNGVGYALRGNVAKSMFHLIEYKKTNLYKKLIKLQAHE